MKRSTMLHLALAGCIIGIYAGCASTKVTNRQQLVTGRLPRPARIWVYDFAATARDVPADSALAGTLANVQSATAKLDAKLDDRRFGFARKEQGPAGNGVHRGITWVEFPRLARLRHRR